MPVMAQTDPSGEHAPRYIISDSSAPMARHLDLTRCCSSFEADWSIVSACRVLTEPSRDLGYAFPIVLVANAEPVIRASYVNDSIHLRERAAEMRVSSKELKDNNAAAAIMRLPDLYDRLADRAEARSDRALQSDGERG
jgi:hypothetical protein